MKSIKEFIKKHRFLLILISLVSIRFFHFSETVDKPHAWRQYDTKQYIEGYYQNNVDFLAPSVSWMGGHKTLILEFPFPEYLVSKLYVIFGNHLWVARSFFLLFFAISVAYFYKSLQLVFNNWVPEIAALIFGLTPLSLFYSRAIHIDFFVLALSFSMLYFCMKGIAKQNFWYLFISMLLAILAFVEKSPYVFFLALPILLFANQQKQMSWFLKRAIIYVIPLICLSIWMQYSKKINEQIPDWSFIPNFNRFTEMWYWYFGTWNQRLEWENWSLVFSRIFNEIIGYSGLILSAVGFLIITKNKGYYFGVAWFLGTLIYLVIFFNLNVIHNYYQLPLVASFAILIALGLQFIFEKLESLKILVGVIVIGLFSFESIYYAENNYYQVNTDFEEIAKMIHENSSSEDLIIVSYGGLSPQCPLILQPAGRYGWSIPWSDLSPQLIHQLYEKGNATKLAVVYGGYFEGEFQYFFEAMENKLGFDIDGEGKALYMCDLQFEQ